MTTTALYNTSLNLPIRGTKPRGKGITMVMDKGLSLRQGEDLVSSCGHIIDFVKLGFGSSLFTGQLLEKVAMYKENNVRPYLGGTLFEAFVAQNKVEDYMRFADKLKLDAVEVSDGSLTMTSEDKCEYISRLSKTYTVLSEVGSKDAKKVYTAEHWVSMMQSELQAGSSIVIAEAREGGNVGICNGDGSIHEDLIETIFSKVAVDSVLWEAPNKNQQIWFIKRFGYDVNLGNIASNEVIPLETLRNGLRGDTFSMFWKA